MRMFTEYLLCARQCSTLWALVVYGIDRSPVLWACVLLEITDNRHINDLNEKVGGGCEEAIVSQGGSGD